MRAKGAIASDFDYLELIKLLTENYLKAFKNTLRLAAPVLARKAKESAIWHFYDLHLLARMGSDNSGEADALLLRKLNDDIEAFVGELQMDWHALLIIGSGGEVDGSESDGEDDGEDGDEEMDDADENADMSMGVSFIQIVVLMVTKVRLCRQWGLHSLSGLSQVGIKRPRCLQSKPLSGRASWTIEYVRCMI
ncbi:hypothetical protein K491DRAFT_524428 [Lophiostoma macrostomum CBS 122681]|uniref:Uncharacterized protein n=1 Tax=Lophiostoma macrostomum CBS 122681 TaxID=1314788 RepID=A0A6A6T1P1_9PLEO|nr:hypothetical protein K491DRAFT_524428 [Lophiostoma macrostomum CBS 122681]